MSANFHSVGEVILGQDVFTLYAQACLFDYLGTRGKYILASKCNAFCCNSQHATWDTAPLVWLGLDSDAAINNLIIRPYV